MIRELSSRQLGQKEFAAGAKRELELRLQEGKKLWKPETRFKINSSRQFHALSRKATQQ